MQDVRQILADFQNGVAGVAESSGAVVDAFMGLQNAAFADGALSVKMKELISVAIGVYNRCQYCIVVQCIQRLSGWRYERGNPGGGYGIYGRFRRRSEHGVFSYSAPGCCQ